MWTVEQEEANYRIELRIKDEDGIDFIDNAFYTKTLYGLKASINRYRKENPHFVINVLALNYFVNNEIQPEWCIEHVED